MRHLNTIETKMMKSREGEILFRTSCDQSIMEYQLIHSSHSKVRSNQRGISDEAIAMATEYGVCYYSQGLNFYVLGKKEIPFQLKKQASKYENTIVVTATDTNKVITCYRNNNPHYWIKHKRKDLVINQNLKYA